VNGRRQAGMQRALIEILTASAKAAGLRRSSWDCQSGGDGELAVLPPEEPEDVLIDGYVRELGQRLDDHNEDLVDGARLRLRMALHHGVAVPAANGYAGAGLVVVSRLVECAAIRAAQQAIPEANLVLIVSNRIFLDTIAQGHTVLRGNRFRKVRVSVKEYVDDAWLYVPGHDVRHVDLVPQDRPTPVARAAQDSVGSADPSEPAEPVLTWRQSTDRDEG